MSATTDGPRPAGNDAGSGGSTAGGGGRAVLTAVAWLWVLVPFVYGVVMLVAKVPALF